MQVQADVYSVMSSKALQGVLDSSTGQPELAQPEGNANEELQTYTQMKADSQLAGVHHALHDVMRGHTLHTWAQHRADDPELLMLYPKERPCPNPALTLPCRWRLPMTRTLLPLPLELPPYAYS